ncbi:helix-turn-helix transcriptional regulator [Gordonia alkanivorans]|uniref:helix-turn-helix transcriptional regulator n=1 Tax=Gordonia alkanivorans TaxID=84096 RepID=UPI0024476A07|nr:helix-turn-helix domain-containing protein [Gordonia alkanivorans]MDH3045344.1 helix-turn-helix domain-containing protein [Gordonia alkanivorans]
MAATPSRARRRHLSLQDVAAELGVSDRTVRRYVANGDLRAIRVSSRIIRIDPADLDAFLAAGASA